MSKINFSNNLKTLRQEKKLTQKQLAATIGVDQRTVSAWENGVCEPSYELLSKLCEIFDQTFDDILS